MNDAPFTPNAKAAPERAQERAQQYLDSLLAHCLRPDWTGEASLVLMVYQGNLRGVHLTTDRKMP